MSLVEVQHPGPAAVPAGRVHRALLRPHQEVVHVVLREAVEAGGDEVVVEEVVVEKVKVAPYLRQVVATALLCLC